MILHLTYGKFVGGFLGVDLFFSLSGFLITYLLMHEWESCGSIRLGRFYMRRILRLYPAVVVTVVGTYFVWPKSELHVYGRVAFAALFYHVNLVQVGRHPLLHMWSLSVEEQFYILYPPVLLFLLSRRKSIITWFLAGIIASQCVRLAMMYRGVDLVFINRFTFARAESFFMGCLAAQWVETRRAQGRRLPLLCRYPAAFSIAGILILSLLCLKLQADTRWLTTSGHTLIALLCSGLVTSAAFLNGKSLISAILRSFPMRYLGTRSYGLYLYHWVIFEATESLRNHHSMANFVLVTILRLVMTFVVTEASFQFVERPFLKLKRRFEPERTKVAMVVTIAIP